MIRIYGMPTCPYCDYIYEQIKGREDEFEYINIGEHIRYLSAFMRLRDNSPVFDHCKEIGDADRLRFKYRLLDRRPQKRQKRVLKKEGDKNGES